MLAAFERNDFPADPNAIFLTVRRPLRLACKSLKARQSWGEWWDPQQQYPLTLDPKLQDAFCPSKEEIEREAHL